MFWNGSTVSTSPMRDDRRASIEARRPPPFWMTMVHALALDAVEDGVGDEVAHLAFLGAAALAAAVDRRARSRRPPWLLSSSIGAPSSLMRATTASIRHERVIEEDRIALGLLDDAVVVEDRR